MLTFYLSLIDDHSFDSKFERIYNKFEKTLFRAAIKMTGDFYGAEEVLNDVFIKVAKHIAEIKEDNEEMLKSLLYKMTKNSAIDYLRKNSKPEAIIDIDTLTDISSGDVFEELEGNSEYLALVELIKKMPSTYRDVLVMNLVYEMSKKQIAKVLNVKENTVASRLKRGKAMLKNCINTAAVKVYEQSKS